MVNCFFRHEDHLYHLSFSVYATFFSVFTFVLLKSGMEGQSVKNLQEDLLLMGYAVSPDGLFGPETEEAVRQFQMDHGFPGDGIVGENTARLLQGFLSVIRHLVQEGDTLSTLAREDKTTVKAIQSASQLPDDTIFVGETLIIPTTNKVFMYSVEVGDSLSSIARRFSSTVSTLMQIKQLQSDRIYVGQMLTILPFGAGGDSQSPGLEEIIHVVQKGETLSFIGHKYRVSVETIQRINQLLNDRIQVHQQLTIPNQPFAGKEVIIGSLIWPVKGPISSPYGWRIHPVTNTHQFHGGIDIVVATGTPVQAAASGIVVKSIFYGWIWPDGCSGSRLRYSNPVCA